MSQYPQAFTLIELLVVITIIVVLLSLLTPAMDKAIYAAEMVQDGAAMKAGANAVVVYAMDHKRRYPYRPGVAAGAWRPNQLTDTYTDERDIYQDYFDINGVFNCPFTDEIDMETSEITWIWGQRFLWFGWKYPGFRGMNKIGDRLSYARDDDADGTPENYTVNVLITEEDKLNRDGNWAIASHPDDVGSLTSGRMQDEGGNADNIPPDLGRYANNNWTFSRWSGAWARGTFDLNNAYDDGSVTAMRKIEHQNDDRVVLLPVMSDGSNPTWENNIPKR